MSKGYEQYFKAVRKQNGKPKNKPAQASGKQRSKVTESELRAAFNMKSKPKKRAPSYVFMTILAAGFVLAAFGYLRPAKIEEWLHTIEISAMAAASAADSETEDTAQTKAQNPENPAGTGEKSSPTVCPDPSTMSEEDLSHFSKLSERKRQLDLREQELSLLEEELHKQRAEVESRIQKLENIRGEISTVLKERVEFDQERVKTLVEFYSNMKPKQAADIFKNLNEDLAVEVLGKMKKKNAAEIMNLLPAQKAKTLSEKFTGYRRR